MTRSTRLTLVIDASIARSAGHTAATSTDAVANRDLLSAVLADERFALGLSNDILAEWKRHYSTYSRTWLTSMMARRRVQRLAPTHEVSIARAVAAFPDEGDRTAAAKDYLLVEAALASDKRVLSNDQRSRRLFARASAAASVLSAIAWLDPVQDRCITWLTEGAPASPDFLLRPP